MSDKKMLIREEIFGSRKYEYFYQDGGLSFRNAQAECEKQEARMLHLKDQDSMNKTTSFLLTQNMSYWWVGLQKSRSTKVWKWTDGEPLNESIFSIAGDMDYTDCAVLLKLRAKRVHLYGLDCRTDTPRYFICESNITSNSPTTDLKPDFNPSSPGSTAALSLSAALLVFAVLFLIFRLCRRKGSYEDTLEEASSKTEFPRVKVEDSDYVDMAPSIIGSRRDLVDTDYEYVDDGGGYASIGPTMKSGGAGGRVNNNEKEEVVYTQVVSIRRSAQMEREELNTKDVYAQIMKKK